MVELRASRASSAPRPRGAAPRQRGSGAPKGRRQSRRRPERPKPGWDEDTRAPSLFDTQLRQIFSRERSQPVSVAAVARPAPQPAPKSQPRHRPGQLRQRLLSTVARQVPPEPHPAEVQSPVATEAEPVQPAPPAPAAPPAALWDRTPPQLNPAPAASVWDRIPPQLNLPAHVSSAPQQLAVAHVQRRRNVSLGERLAILLPQPGSLPEKVPADVPGRRPPETMTRIPMVPETKISITAPETPEKVKKLSEKLNALLGPRDHTSSVPKFSSHELLLQLGLIVFHPQIRKSKESPPDMTFHIFIHFFHPTFYVFKSSTWSTEAELFNSGAPFRSLGGFRPGANHWSLGPFWTPNALAKKHGPQEIRSSSWRRPKKPSHKAQR